MKKYLLPIFATFMILSGIGTTTSADAATQTQLTQTASKYIGVPYVYGGTSTKGFDCSGYTQYVFKQLGISLNRTAASQFTQGTAVSKANLQVGDLVFFNTLGRTASHVGIYVGNGKFAHAGTSTGVTVASLNSSYWAPKYDGARRVAKFTNGTTTASKPATSTSQVLGASIDFSVYASRGEVALKLAKELGLDTSDTTSVFPDVASGSKYAGAAKALNKLGIFTGDQNGRFNANSPLTRETMAKVLVKAYNLQNKGTTINFTDVSTSAWSYEVIQTLASNGVTIGVGNNKYGRTNNVKISDLNTFIERAKAIK